MLVQSKTILLCTQPGHLLLVVNYTLACVMGSLELDFKLCYSNHRSFIKDKTFDFMYITYRYLKKTLKLVKLYQWIGPNILS